MQYKVRKNAISILNEIDKNRAISYIIHYSCGSFTESETGYSPRITSIAIYNLESGQTTSFSIHQVAEIKSIAFENIEVNYDSLEKEMLQNYFDFLNSHQTCKWIHWNMRNSNYGFKAIEHRFKVLGGVPVYLDDTNKIDLAKLFNEIYGDKYISHPKMENIIRKNEISMKDFMTGEEEARAFKNKEFVKLHQSTLRKVYAFSFLYDLALNKKLKSNSKWIDQYGFSLQGIYDYCTTNVFIVLIWNIIMLFLGGFIGSLFN